MINSLWRKLTHGQTNPVYYVGDKFLTFFWNYIDNADSKLKSITNSLQIHVNDKTLENFLRYGTLF